MDSLYRQAVVDELQGLLPGSRIDKVQQPAAAELIFSLWNRGHSYRLLLSCEPGRFRLHLVTGLYPNPATPPRFCQLLRARLQTLEAIEQSPGIDGVVLRCGGKKGRHYRLYMERRGQQGNLVLVDEKDLVVDALIRVAGGNAPVLPGRPHIMTTVLKGSPPEQLLDEVPSVAAEAFRGWLFDHVRPMPRYLAEDLVRLVTSGRTPRKAVEALVAARGRQQKSCVIAEQDGRFRLLPFVLGRDTRIVAKEFDSPSAAAEAYYREFLPSRDQRGAAGELNGLVNRQLKKLEQRRKRIEQDRRGLAEADLLRQQGELLLAQSHRIPRGAASILLDNDFHQPAETIRIALDPRLTPWQNAEQLFRRYKKLKRGREHMERRLTETEQEMEWLQGVALALSEARSGSEFLVIRAELIEQGLLKEKGNTSRSQIPKKIAGVRDAVTPGGYRLFWGVNNRANDHVSRSLCQAADLWFHVHEQPGCHLILKHQGKGEVPLEDQRFAAALAAGYSRAGNEGRATVMVSEGRWVSKPTGARPGLVTVRQFKTLRVVPQRMDPVE